MTKCHLGGRRCHWRSVQGPARASRSRESERVRQSGAHHVAHCSNEGVLTIARVSQIDCFRDSKISEFHNSMAVEKNVAGFDVAVHVAVRVKEFQAKQHLERRGEWRE
jgi:hypothetical protein